MAKSYKSAQYLNQRISTIMKNGYRPISDFTMVRQNYNYILKPQGRKNGQLIMTYEEAKNYLSKYTGDNPLTVEEYTKQLHDFQEQYADRLSLAGEKHYQREHMMSVIEDASEWLGEKRIGVSKISTNELKEIFWKAREATEKIKGEVYKAFYEYLYEYIKEYKELHS